MTMSSNIFKSCSIEGCERNAHRSARGIRGYCENHYKRFRRHGDPLGGGTSRGEPLRFINEVVLSYSGDDCLIWPYGRNADGRAQCRIDGKQTYVQRYVCKIAHGEPPTPKHESAHSCGKGHLGCVAKSHLSWKTMKENQADRLIHGTSPRGENSGSAKLTEPQVIEIRALRGLEPTRAIAKRYSVSPQTVSAIQTGRKWAWLS